MNLPSHIHEAMRRHGEATYPEECCGVLLADADGNLRLRECRNVQNDLHAQDPEKHPRTARNGYTIDPKELLDITRVADASGGAIRAIYHSHPDVGAYFSTEDRARAIIEDWDEPVYPDAAYIVLSVRDGKMDAAKAFVWDDDKRDYVEQPIVET